MSLRAIKKTIEDLVNIEMDNISNQQQLEIAEDLIEVLENKRMPLRSYTWMHSEAKLSQEDRQRLMAYFESIRKI